jgi:hypothetical protein
MNYFNIKKNSTVRYCNLFLGNHLSLAQSQPPSITSAKKINNHTIALTFKKMMVLKLIF